MRAANILIPVFSDTADRDHNAVVLNLSDSYLERLEARVKAFHEALALEPTLYNHEYRDGPVNLGYIVYEDGTREEVLEVYDIGLAAAYLLEAHHGDGVQGIDLEPINGVYCAVTERGIFWNFAGAYGGKYGPSETYETETVKIEDLRELFNAGK